MLPAGPGKLDCVYLMCLVLNAELLTRQTHVKTHNFGKLLDSTSVPGFFVGILSRNCEAFSLLER